MDTNESPEFIRKADEQNEVEIVNGVDVKRLTSLIERIENVEAEISALKNDVKEIFDEAKSAGFEIKAMKQILKLRKKDKNERDEEAFFVQTYCEALGM